MSTVNLHVDLLIASGRDIEFCTRFLLSRGATRRCCIVLLEGEKGLWEKSPELKHIEDTNVVRDQAVIERGKNYFVTAEHTFHINGTATWLKKQKNMAQGFSQSLLQLLSSGKCELTNCIVLNTLPSLGFYSDILQCALHVWRELPSKLHLDIKDNLRECGREEILAEFNKSRTEGALFAADKEATAGRESQSMEAALLYELQRSCDMDMRHFRQSWLLKIIKQRCDKLNYVELKDYLAYLHACQQESTNLLKAFFWHKPDPKQFSNTLNTAGYLYSLLNKHSKADKHFRIWIPLCALGEAAYALSLAWKVRERDNPQTKSIAIFATELIASSLELAERGLREECIQQLSLKEKRWFQGKAHDNIVAAPALRNHIVFSFHDLFHTAPYRHLDLIVCHGDLSMYKEAARRQLLSTFNSCLENKGLLWLPSNIGNMGDFGFTVVDKSQRIYMKEAGYLPLANSAAQLRSQEHFAPPISKLLKHHRKRNRYSDYHRIFDQLIDKYMRPGVLLDEVGELVHVIGDVSPYLLSFRGGTIPRHILQLLRPSLKTQLYSSISQLIEHKKNTNLQVSCALHENEPKAEVDVEMRSFEDSETGGFFCAILFCHVSRSDPLTAHKFSNISASPTEQEYTIQLERELIKEKESHLRQVDVLQRQIELQYAQIEQLGLQNHQLQFSNQQLSEWHEEYLESMSNEKISESNHKLVSKYMPMGVGIFNRNLELNYFNAALQQYLLLSSSDLGQNINDIACFIRYQSLQNAIEQCLKAKLDWRCFEVSGLEVQLQAVPYESVMLSVYKPTYANARGLAQAENRRPQHEV